MFYVLNASPTEARSSLLTLEGVRSAAEGRRKIAWQAEGGFDPAQFVVCTFDRKANRFVSRPEDQPAQPRGALITPQVCTWTPDRGPFTVEAFAAFCARIGYRPDAGEDPAPVFSFGDEVSDGDESTVEAGGFTFTATIYDDPDNAPPWENEDGHGPVSDWRSLDSQKPGELVVSADGHRVRFYDMAEAVDIAKRDSWGPGTPEEAAAADYQYLKAWCCDEWRYVGVAVVVSKAGVALTGKYQFALWGIDSTSGDHCANTAAELAAEALPAARAKLAELAR